MSDSIVNQAADRRGPLRRTTLGGFTPHIICISADGSTHPYDLSSASYFNSEQYMDRYVTISVEGGASFWWYWSDDAAGIVDKAATGNGVTVGAFCPSGLLQDERPTARYLILQTSAAANVHLWLSSGKF